MLSGRESLIRLVGKRRRTLPSGVLSLLRDVEGNEPLSGDGASTTDDCTGCPSSGGLETVVGGVDRVYCPVCGSSIPGADIAVNTHLDACLARGTKRKLIQRTLLHYNSDSKSKRNLPDGLPESEISNGDKLTTDTSWKCICVGDLGKICPQILSNESQGCLDDAYCDSSYGSAEVSAVGACESSNSVSEKAFETYIVGSRFHENADLQEGFVVSLLRDPQNEKDTYAIQVIYADSGYEKMLGYLPRDLARYLSILIDDYHLKFEGLVTSVPKGTLDAISIRLVCANTKECSTLEPNNRMAFQSLWRNVTRVVENAKLYPPNMPKYQQNFCVLLGDVLGHNSFLFNNDEKLLLGSFKSLSDDAQRLFIRLCTRKGPWFRLDKISYTEILDIHNAANELQKTGYMDSFPSSEQLFKDEIVDLLDVLTASEMRDVLNLVLHKKVNSLVQRMELVRCLCSSYRTGGCPILTKAFSDRAGICVKISSTAEMLLWRVQRLFFLNGEQDLSSFLLVDLGLVKFPKYTCHVSFPIFRNRNDLLAYEEAIAIAQVIDQSLDENNLDMVLRCINIAESCMKSFLMDEVLSSAFETRKFLQYFSSSWVYSKVLFLGVSVLEREHRYGDAVRILEGLLRRFTCDSRRGRWSLRLSLDLEHMGCIEKSLSVAEQAVMDPWVRAGSEMAIKKRILRLGKPPRRWKVPSFANSINRKIKELSVPGRPLNSETGSKNLFYGYDGELCGVEQLALQYYADEGGGWQGVHSESGIWMTIFGLLMWDVIFADVPNVFRTRFQTAPLDFDTDDFYTLRKDLVESQLQKIREGMAEELLLISWDLHFGTACRGVRWDRHSLPELRAAVACVGGPRMAALCRSLALDYRSWSSGMPDLFLWRLSGGDDGGEAKLVEVKGPRDRLSEQQRAWLLLLMDCGFDVEVCKVASIAS